MKLLKWLLAVLLLCAAAFPQSEPTSGGLPAASAPTRRVKVAPDQAAALVLQKVAVKYPDAARNAGVQGTVELGVVVDESGDVKEVTILSGDPALGQAASEAVKEWKYKPYVVDGSPAEMETQVTLSFHFQTKAVPAPLPLGTFYNDAYFNEYFGLYYPLSRDWVRETQLMRKKLASDSVPQSTYVLLAAVYVPQSASLLDVDSSFTLFALGQPNPDCRRYLEAAAADLQSHKEGQQKGDISQFKLAGRDFYRGNYEHSSGASHRSVVCTAAKDYLLLWNIGGLTKNAVETAVATLNGITAAPPPPTVKAPAPPPSPESSQTPAGQQLCQRRFGFLRESPPDS